MQTTYYIGLDVHKRTISSRTWPRSVAGLAL